jgi:type IV pilus assembly protein PilC
MPENNSFAYQAQTDEGAPLTGTIDAASAPEAIRKLTSLRMRVLSVSAQGQPARPKPLRGDDFAAFNQQLAHLTASGLPLEQGLRLIAQDMRSGRLAASVRSVADELEAGTPLKDAFEKHRARFPALYGQLIDAGVRSGNLPGMLLNLGQHLELVQRLRAAVWRAASYPLMVLAGVVAIVIFLGLYVLPQFGTIYESWHIELPTVTRILMGASAAMPVVGIVVLSLVVGIGLIWRVLRWKGRDQAVLEQCLLPLPMLGPVMRQSLLARWCDAVRIGIDGGLDLPAAITLAGEAIGSPRLLRDSRALVDALQRDGRVHRPQGRSLLPATVLAGMQFAADHQDLSAVLGNLARMYQQQAEIRMGVLQSVLTPIFILCTASVIGFIVAALFMPLTTLFGSVTGPR